MKVRVFGLALAPWRFLVVSAASFSFALSAGGAWFPTATAESSPLGLLLSAQVVSFGLLLGAAAFLYVGVRGWKPRWTNAAVLFNAAMLGSYVGNQFGGL